MMIHDSRRDSIHRTKILRAIGVSFALFSIVVWVVQASAEAYLGMTKTRNKSTVEQSKSSGYHISGASPTITGRAGRNNGISVGDHPFGVAVTPNGSYVYVTNFNDNTVSVIQTSDKTVIATISVGEGPRYLAVTPNGSYVYVANSNAETLSVIQTSDKTVADTISVADYPLGVAVAPNGSDVYVTNSQADTVSVIRTSDKTVTGTISVGDHPFGIAVAPSGSYVYVANYYGDTVKVIELYIKLPKNWMRE